MALLDLNTAHDLVIKADHDKDFQVVWSGFDNLDTDYTLTLSKKGYPSKNHVFAVGTDITLDTVLKTITINFDGSDYEKGTYEGILESVNPDFTVFYRCNITLEVI